MIRKNSANMMPTNDKMVYTIKTARLMKIYCSSCGMPSSGRDVKEGEKIRVRKRGEEGKEGRRERAKKGRREERRERGKEGGKKRKREGRKEGRKKGRRERGKEGGKEGRRGGGKEEVREGRKSCYIYSRCLNFHSGTCRSVPASFPGRSLGTRLGLYHTSSVLLTREDGVITLKELVTTNQHST